MAPTQTIHVSHSTTGFSCDDSTVTDDQSSILDEVSLGSFNIHDDVNDILNAIPDYNSKKSHSSSSTKIDLIDDIIRAFNLPKSTKKNLPSLRELREKNLKTRNPKRYGSLITASMKCIKRIIQILCPGPNQKDLIESLAGTKIFRNNKGETTMSTIVPRNRKTSSITDSDILRSLVQTSFDLMKLSPKGSIQRRVIRAVLVKSISKTSILREFSTYFNHPRIDAGTIYSQAKADYDTMEKGCIVSKAEYSRKRVSDDIVEEAVEYILHKDNIATVSWGNSDCVLSKDETVVLPQITRRASRKILWERYRDHHLETGDEYLKRTSFYLILKMLTRSDQKILSSIDYVQSLLVTDTIENLQNMLDDIVEDSDEMDVLADYLSSLTIFLKYGYPHHTNIMNDDCTTHDLKFILGNSMRRMCNTSTTSEPKD